MTRSRHFPLVLLFLGVLLHLPSVTAGFWVDDYLLQLRLSGELPGSPWGLYDFGTLANWTDIELQVGTWPWWTSPDWTARFLRPVSSGLLAVQHALFGGWALGYHLCSLSMFALVLVIARRVLIDLGLSQQAALGATALLAVTKTAGFPVGWIANQNTLVETLCTCIALWCVASPAGRSRPLRLVLALVFASLSALAKESGVGTLLLVAWLCRREQSAVASTALVLFAGYLALHLGGGYGTNALFYASPFDAPVRFAVRLAELGPNAALALGTPIVTDLATFLPPARQVQLGIGVPLLFFVVRFLARHTKGHPATPLLVLWFVLAAAPQAAAPLSDRLLFGAAPPALALLVIAVEASRSRLARRLTIAGPGVLGGLMLLGMGLNNVSMADGLREAALTAPVGTPEDGHREVFVLQSTSSLIPFSIGQTYAVERPEDRGLSFHALQMGRRGLRLTRTADDRVEIESQGRPFLDQAFEIVYRSSSTPPAVGTVTTWNDVRFEVLEIEGAGVRRFAVSLDRSLDARSVIWLTADGNRYKAIELPAVGDSLELAEVIPAHPLVP
ncbi:MAG: hypothetical protein O2816_03090 [Planctomycetota bacterium]|nr:hypothetical protein [Planctomycetota bacterium]